MTPSRDSAAATQATLSAGPANNPLGRVGAPRCGRLTKAAQAARDALVLRMVEERMTRTQIMRELGIGRIRLWGLLKRLGVRPVHAGRVG